MLNTQLSCLVILLCCMAMSSLATHYGTPLIHHVSPAGPEAYPPAFVISTINPSDKHGHEHRGYGHGHRDYVNLPKYVIRNPYGVPLKSGGGQRAGFYGGGGDIEHLASGPPGYYGGGSDY